LLKASVSNTWETEAELVPQEVFRLYCLSN